MGSQPFRVSLPSTHQGLLTRLQQQLWRPMVCNVGLGSYSDPGPLISLLNPVVALLAAAFLLIGYYTVLYRYCLQSYCPLAPDAEEGGPAGVEAVIGKITVCRYKEGDGLLGGATCSICLAEFQDDESIGLLPRCRHGYHVQCIDTWFKSQQNCPLCRTRITG